MLVPPTARQRSRSLFWIIWATTLMKWSLKCACRSGCGAAVTLKYGELCTAMFEDAGQRRIISYKTLQEMRKHDAEFEAKLKALAH